MWFRAPFVLLRYPRLLVSLGVGSLLVVVAIAAYPLFVSSISAGLVDGEVAKPLVTRYGAGVRFTATNQEIRETLPGLEGFQHEARDRMFSSLVAANPQLGAPLASILGPEIVADSPDERARTFDGRLAFSEGALDHVGIVSGDPDGPPGAWVPEQLAEALHVREGETLTVESDEGRTADIPVAGVYENLYSAPRQGYWVQWATEIYPSFAACSGPCDEPVIPSQFILLDHDAILSTMEELGTVAAGFGWQAPLRSEARLTLDHARELDRFVTRLRVRMSDEGTEVGRVFRCCGRRHPSYGVIAQETSLTSRIDQVIGQVEERIAAIETPGRVLQIAGIVVALSVLAAAGSFSVAARGTEGRLLFARGMSPAQFGARSSLEAVLPAVLGGVAGLGAIFLLVSTIGPSGPVAASDARVAVIGGALGILGALVAVGMVSAASYHARFEHRSGRLRMLARFPWELVLLAVAAYSFRELQSGAALVEVGGIRRPGLFLLLFPLALLGGIAGAGARLLRGGFARLADRAGGARSSIYLALHRLAAGTLVTVLLVAAAGLSIGLFLHSRTVVRSLQETVDAKSHVFVGSDVQAWVSPDVEAPEGFPFPVTRVTRIRDAGTIPGQADEFDLLAVDPTTLVAAAYWNERFSGEPFRDLVGRLEQAGGPVPVIVAGNTEAEFDRLELNQRPLDVSIVARTRAFPGMLGHRPLMVFPTEALREAYGLGDPFGVSNSRAELWFRGPTGEIVDDVAALDITPFQVITAAQIEDIPYVAAVIQTFVVLNSLSLAAAILVVAALLMYLEARQRSQLVAYGLSARMGMRPASHAWSLTIEIASMLLGALVLGGVAALVAAYLVGPYLDPLTSVPPGPLFDPPVLLVGATVAALVAVSWLGGWLTERRARRVPFGEVMRVADA